MLGGIFLHKKSKILVIITVFIITLAYIVPHIALATSEMYVWSDKSESLVQTNIQPATTQTGNFLNITSGAAVLMEQKTGKILYEYNAHEKLRPASVTKIMTLLLIMEAIDSGRLKYTDKIPCSDNARNMGGSQIWLDTTEQLTVDEMLKAICVVSANDCTVAMAEYLAGSEEAFVAQMNAKAKELGMNNIYMCSNNQEASEKLMSTLKRGDVVLLKGSRGMELEEILEKLYGRKTI